MAPADRRSARQRASSDPVARYFGDLQAEVLTLFWTRENATVPEVVQELNRGRRRKLAYTTVLTLVTRLWQRDLLTRTQEGRGFRYRAAGSRDDVLAQLSDRLIDQLFDDFGEIAVARLGERLDDLDPTRIDKLTAARRKRPG